jgi:hypothetical protein
MQVFILQVSFAFGLFFDDDDDDDDNDDDNACSPGFVQQIVFNVHMRVYPKVSGLNR